MTGHKKVKKLLRPEEKEALRAMRREEFGKIIEKHIAIRHAMDKGLKVSNYTMEQMIGMYLEDTKEETIRLAIKELGMTREEAIEQGYIHGSTQVSFEVERREESKRLGKEITHKELMDIYQKRLRNSKYPGPECISPWEVEYLNEHNKWPGEDPTPHIKTCSGCEILLSAMRPVQIQLPGPPGPDCYTQSELGQVTETGYMPLGRLEHKNSCQKCRSKLSSAQEDYIEKIVPDQPYDPIDLDFKFSDKSAR